MRRFFSRRQRGLSLVELAVAMVIVGILGLIVWRWVMATREPLQRRRALRAEAELGAHAGNTPVER